MMSHRQCTEQVLDAHLSIHVHTHTNTVYRGDTTRHTHMQTDTLDEERGDTEEGERVEVGWRGRRTEGE